MDLNYLLIIVAILISATAGFFSVVGLISIFSGAVISVAIMGTVLEVGKISTTLWLHKNWEVVPSLLKTYLCTAVVILGCITSLGIFGYLSRAHIQQSIGSDSLNSKLAIYDNQISSITQEQNSNNQTLKQLDGAISQVISLSSNQQGATKALNLRNNQSSERSSIQKVITEDQKKIDELKEEEAPIKLQLQKNEIDVGPIKFIAALIYGANPSQDLLEKAVRWVIILLVSVFDPLALSMLIAADSSLSKQKELISETPIAEAVVPLAALPTSKARKPRRAHKEIAKQIDEVTENGQKLVGKMILPENAPEGTLFISTESIPGKLYKVINGIWVEASKEENPNYINSSYIEFLKKHIAGGTIDLSQLTKEELEAIKKPEH